MNQILTYIKRDGIKIFSRKILFKILVFLRLNRFLKIKLYGKYFALEDTDLTYQLFANKKYKDSEYAIYKKYITPEMVCVDVGANIGLMTLMFLGLAESGIVHSFEPSERMYKILKKNLGLNSIKNCITYNVALGRAEGNAKFDETVTDDTTFRMSATGSKSVVQKRLDTIFTDTAVIDFMKIDVEGYEMEVLLGGVETLKKTKLLFIEFITDNQESTEHSPAELIELLNKNFSVYALNSDLREVPFVYSKNQTYQTDLLCRLR